MPFPVYEETIRMADRLAAENETLRQRVDLLYREDSSVRRDRPGLIGRLEETIQIAEDRLAVMNPYREIESRVTLNAITDELRRIILRLRDSVSTPTDSPSP